MIFLDANASEPIRPEALDAMTEAASLAGNPSSVHRAGKQARAVLDRARRDIASAFGASEENCVFTSGGTEACALAVSGLSGGRRVLIGATEHDAVRRAAPQALSLPVRESGELCLDSLERALADFPVPALVCVMAANNETGVLHPLGDIARICAGSGALLHVDAVQAAGRVPVSLLPGVTSLAISGHKFGGPKGAGALLLAGSSVRALPPLFEGGGQERGRRGGTQPLPAIAGMAAALVAALATREAQQVRLAGFRDRIEEAERTEGAEVFGATAPRLANTLNFAVPGMRSEALLIALDMEGVCVSAGSACSSGKVAPSHVLAAMGAGDLAGQALRVSLPWNCTEGDVAAFIAIRDRMNRRRRGE
ncbi:cysteine desulfurase [Acetobacter sp. AN02]|uniref:cysteine desulfurase family protein n=1 Tax=Acetobacter sp. AN02 TaxID=2894186 RepID=UPI0024342771|nr:cysteine desulfurase family protein [Acetobacter sp. AN02]MDG6094196.1 cysteine desulfurase [Acetobacter sp. AN02]